MKAWLSPIRILLLYLTGMAILATILWSGQDLSLYLTLLRNLALLYIPSLLTHELLLKTKVIAATRWEHRVITCLILFLLFDSLIPWWIFLVLGIVTELLQRIIRLPTGPLANPAALGIIVTSVLFGYLPTWWATNFGPRIEDMMSLAFVLTVPIAGYVVYKYKKLWIVTSAAIATSIASVVVLQVSPVYLLVDGTLAFFLLVMCSEPKTSPIIRHQQIIYGGFIGAVVILGLHWAWLEPFTIPLVIANIVYNLYRNKPFLLKKIGVGQPAVPPPVSPQPSNNQ